MRRSFLPPSPELLEDRVVLSTVVLQGTLKGYSVPQPTPVLETMTSDLHVLGTLNTLGTTYGGGVEVDHDFMGPNGVHNELITINGTGGSVTVQLSETVPVTPILMATGTGAAPGEVASYSILGGTGNYVGASGQGLGMLTPGPDILLPGAAAGQTTPTFTLQFLQAVALSGSVGGSGTATVNFSTETTGVSTATTTITGSGAVDPIGMVSLSGSLDGYLIGTSAGYSGQLVLTGTAGSVTLEIEGNDNFAEPAIPNSSPTFPTDVSLNYSIVSGTGIYQDLVDYGTVEISLPSPPMQGASSETYTGAFSAVLTSTS